MCVSKFVQREGWLLHRMRRLLNYCQGRAGQWGSQGQGRELNSSWSWEGSVQPSEEGRKKTQTRERAKESSARLCKAEQVFCFHDQCVQSHSIGELNNIQYAECTE